MSINKLFCINWDKSKLTPTQQIDFMGVHFNLQQDLVHPTKEKIGRLVSKAAPFDNNQVVPAQAWESLLGLLSHLETSVPWKKIHLHSNQQNLPVSYRPQIDPGDLPVLIWEESTKVIQW